MSHSVKLLQEYNQHWAIRRHYLATLHILGASFKQLGEREGTSPQAMAQAIYKATPRPIARIKGSMTAGELEYWHTIYNTRLHKFTVGLNPLEAASWMHIQHPYHNSDKSST